MLPHLSPAGLGKQTEESCKRSRGAKPSLSSQAHPPAPTPRCLFIFRIVSLLGNKMLPLPLQKLQRSSRTERTAATAASARGHRVPGQLLALLPRGRRQQQSQQEPPQASSCWSCPIAATSPRRAITCRKAFKKKKKKKSEAWNHFSIKNKHKGTNYVSVLPAPSQDYSELKTNTGDDSALLQHSVGFCYSAADKPY